MRIYSIIFSLLFSLIANANAQNSAFQAGEKLTYTAAYNMSGMLTDLAEVKMETSTINTSSATLLRLKCTASTYSKWDNFFKIRDIYESYVSPKTITPYLYQRDIEEGGHYKFVKYKFQHNNNTVQSLRRQKSTNFESGFWDRNSKISIQPYTKDLVSTLYKLRTLDLETMPIGTAKTFTVLFDAKEHKVTFTILKQEYQSTIIGIKPTYKIAITIPSSNVLEGKNTNLIWLTADKNKIPVYATFKIPVGTGELKLIAAKGLKN